MAKFYRRSIPSKGVYPNAVYSDLYDNNKSTTDICSGNVSGVENTCFVIGDYTLPSRPTFGDAQMVGAKLGFYINSITQGGGNKIGPKLWNVMFRQVGAVNDYKYSKALSSYNKEWNWEEMNGFLIKPAKWIPNNKMGFAGLKSEKDRASVILYLNQNSDNPQPLP